MNDQELVDELRARGSVSEQQIALWRDVANLMAVLDAIGRDGVSAVVKIDGARLDGAAYSVVVTGPRLGEAFFRQDGRDLSTLLRAAINFYREAGWAADAP